MSDFYQRMQGVSSKLLKQFNQGVIAYTPIVPPVNDWDSPTTGTPITLDATAGGVSQKYLSDLITTSDIELSVAVFGTEPTMSGKIHIDGIERQIIAIQQLPAAGIPVAWKIWVKG